MRVSQNYSCEIYIWVFFEGVKCEKTVNREFGPPEMEVDADDGPTLWLRYSGANFHMSPACGSQIFPVSAVCLSV